MLQRLDSELIIVTVGVVCGVVDKLVSSVC